MKFRIAAVIGVSLLLSGCSDANLGDWFTFPDFLTGNTAEAPAAGSATAATAASRPPSAFCRSVAQQDATGKAFDPATQARMAQKSYAQCTALYGAN